MAFLRDTDFAIHLRDGDAKVAGKVSALGDAVLLSIVTRVELEGGVYRDPAFSQVTGTPGYAPRRPAKGLGAIDTPIIAGSSDRRPSQWLRRRAMRRVGTRIVDTDGSSL